MNFDAFIEKWDNEIEQVEMSNQFDVKHDPYALHKYSGHRVSKRELEMATKGLQYDEDIWEG